MRTPLVTSSIVLAISLLVAATTSSPPPPAIAADAPVKVYAKLDGVWKGVFVGYDPAGKELYRIQVEQTYETVSETVQKVRISDTMPDGTVITGEGENVARRLADGTLDLKCIVRKSNGEQARHDGRLVRGPDGDEQLVWYTKQPDRTETFRESVRTEGEKSVYEINGMGRYGSTSMLMHGRYYRR